jgi:hypothetical protein
MSLSAMAAIVLALIASRTSYNVAGGLRVAAEGGPGDLLISPGEVHEVTCAAALLDGIEKQAVVIAGCHEDRTPTHGHSTRARGNGGGGNKLARCRRRALPLPLPLPSS